MGEMTTMSWPKGPTYWREQDNLFISIPFTWNLPKVKTQLKQTGIAYTSVIVGGPAVALMPKFFNGLDYIRVGHSCPGVLQKVNPWATRTTEGCIRYCKFCGIGQGKIEPGKFKELSDWPDLPLICDSNLLASSQEHFNKVIDRLKKWKSPDFNQGLDCRLITEYHAQRFAELKQPKIRLSCDSFKYIEDWQKALEMLLRGGVKKSYISTYVLIGFDSGVDEAWARCEFINQSGTCNPMWFHALDTLKVNQVTREQQEMGWTQKERIRIMRRFYQAKFGGFDTPTAKANGILRQILY